MWEGFIKCCQRIKLISHQVLLQLPRAQLVEVFTTAPDLKEHIVKHVVGLNPQQVGYHLRLFWIEHTFSVFLLCCIHISHFQIATIRKEITDTRSAHRYYREQRTPHGRLRFFLFCNSQPQKIHSINIVIAAIHDNNSNYIYVF